MREIPIEETKRIMKNMNAYNTVGFDRIFSKVLKRSLDISTILITHGINVSIRTANIPDSLKIARVLPILKSKKNAQL